ncbi:MAG: hypothetical protein IB618_01435 [Candidatus Pacearchaeota archaeon]|nr:MAG: hypothetical protein IB618_01435 [Candidatus Pacearchaeota archaeon]
MENRKDKLDEIATKLKEISVPTLNLSKSNSHGPRSMYTIDIAKLREIPDFIDFIEEGKLKKLASKMRCPLYLHGEVDGYNVEVLVEKDEIEYALQWYEMQRDKVFYVNYFTDKGHTNINKIDVTPRQRKFTRYSLN